MNARLCLVTTLLIVAAIPIWYGIWELWSWLVLDWHYRQWVEALDPTRLLLWALHLVVCIGLGLFAVVVGQPKRPLVFGAVVGIVFELIQTFGTRDFVAPDFRYGLYVVAPLGSFLGAGIALRFIPRNDNAI